MMDGEGNVDAVGGLSEGVDVLAGERVGWLLMEVWIGGGGCWVVVCIRFGCSI